MSVLFVSISHIFVNSMLYIATSKLHCIQILGARK